MVTLEHTLRMLKIPILDDGVVSLGETSILLRAIQPFAVRGNGEACELRDLLVKVRQDGIITKDESARVARLLDKITRGSVNLAQYAFQVPGFPSDGKTFVDTSRFLDTPWLFQMVLDLIDEQLVDAKFDLVAAPEPRGTAFGAAVAARHKCGFVPIVLPGRLPRETLAETFESAFGPRELQMHADSVMRGERVLVVDDLLATGGSAAAVSRLVTRAGGTVVKSVFIVELEDFKARAESLKGADVSSLVKLRSR